MAYVPTTPSGPSEDPSQSQPKITANFEGISTFVQVNHGNFDDPDEGKHLFMQMPVQGAAPTTGATEGALYTKTLAAQAELYYRKQSSGAEVQMTGPFTAAANGLVTLPGGLIIIWGTASSGNGLPVSYHTAFPTASFTVQVTQNTTGALAVGAVVVDNTQFTFFSNPAATISFSYLAIGN